MKRAIFLFLIIQFSPLLFSRGLPYNNDVPLYEAWLNLDNALNSSQDESEITEYQKAFLLQIEVIENSKTYNLTKDMYGINQQLESMKNACENRDGDDLSRLINSYLISKEYIYEKSNSISVQLVILMGILILCVMALLFFYRFTYARRLEVEKILKATNKGQEEERRRIALELHDSVAQQMRYVSLLAEEIPDEQLSKKIKMHQSECIENLRNTCYTLSSINMDKSSFKDILKNAVDSFQKRTGITASLVITQDVDLDCFSQLTYHHIFRIIMELLTNIEKHSEAHEVTLLFRNPVASDKFSNGLIIFVSDDGKGISSDLLEKINSKNLLNIKDMHFGLQNIKLRLKEINGNIKYISEEGEGTEVQIRIKK